MNHCPQLNLKPGLLHVRLQPDATHVITGKTWHTTNPLNPERCMYGCNLNATRAIPGESLHTITSQTRIAALRLQPERDTLIPRENRHTAKAQTPRRLLNKLKASRQIKCLKASRQTQTSFPPHGKRLLAKLNKTSRQTKTKFSRQTNVWFWGVLLGFKAFQIAAPMGQGPAPSGGKTKPSGGGNVF